MILQSMPPIWDETFRLSFYQHWGKENCIIAARTNNACYPLYQQRLSIKAAWGGREEYFVDGSRIAVDDDTFIILNDGRTYESQLSSLTPVLSFSIFFRPGMAAEVARTHASSLESLMDDPHRASANSIEFSERAHVHDRLISPVLRYIQQSVDNGITDESWYEEQLYFLLQRMLALHVRDLQKLRLIPATRASTRKELFRRIGLGVNFINTNFAEPIGLEHIARSCLLSPYHCLRVFKFVYGMTPTAYLTERRIKAAHRLLRGSNAPMEDVAAGAGFQSRTTLFRQMKRSLGAAPSFVRRSYA